MRRFLFLSLAICLVSAPFPVTADPRSGPPAPNRPNAANDYSEELLNFYLNGLGFPSQAKPTTAPQAAADEHTLKSANLHTDTEALLNFFRRRTLTAADQDKVRGLIRQLGSDVYRLREQAAAELIARGPGVVELLREARKNADLEVIRRAERCLQRIQETDYSIEVPAAAARLLAVRRPAAVVETLLAYLPFADSDIVSDEVRNTLAAVAVKQGKPDELLVAALDDKLPLRRAAAGEALLQTHFKDIQPAVRKLLKDSDPAVRLRISMALTSAQDRNAVPVLIDLLPKLTLVQAWQAEDILYRLSADRNPPAVSLGPDEVSREKCRIAWSAWWKANADKVDLAKLNQAPRLLGYTVVVLLDADQIVDLGPNKQPRLTLDNLSMPLDVQPLANGNMLVSEYQASRVAERTPKGEIVWERRIVGPLVGQRLPNGNTFIATDSLLIEVDPKGKEVMSITLPGKLIMKAMKTRNGEIACLTTDGRVVRLDANGKEIHGFPVSLSVRLFGGRIDVLPNGNVLVPHNGENKVVEYNGAGKPVWEVTVDQPIAATRLSNGNTLVTSMQPARGAMEFDRRGNMVWQFAAGNSRVTRALRR